MRSHEILRMPPGDRGPALRLAAFWQLMALDALEGAPREPGRDATIARARRIATRRTSLRQLLALARHHGVTLPAAVAARASRPLRESRAMTNKLDTLTSAVTTALQQALADGVPVVEVIEAGMTAVVGLSVEHEGQFKAGARLILVGEQLSDSSPEMRARRERASN